MTSDVTPPAPPPRPLSREPQIGHEYAPGDRIGDYVVLGTLSAGGFGTIYSAEHRLLGRRAAIKVLHSELAGSAEMVQRFIREAQVVNRIHHPNIVDVFGFGETQAGQPFLLMELLDGPSLRALLDERGRLPAAEALTFLEPIAAALDAAHAAGVIHRDLKASNVVVPRTTGAGGLKLLDFGIAKLQQPDPAAPGLTTAGQRLGTPHAMAPEQIRGSGVGPAADVYGLGVLLYQMLTGRVPFDAPDPAELERLHLEVPPPPPSRLAPVPPAVDSVVLRCLEKDPVLRYRTAGAVAAALREALGLKPASAPAAPSARAVAAVFVEALLDPQADTDDDALAALGDALDLAENELTAAGFQVFLATASSLLAARVLHENPSRARLQRRSAWELVRTLSAASKHPSVHLRCVLHAGAAEVQPGPNGPEVTGGPAMDVERWPVSQGVGAQATAAALEGLD